MTHNCDPAIRTLMLLLLLALARPCAAQRLPGVDELERQLADAPVAIEVVEPHLMQGRQRPHVTYLGYPAARVLAAIFGKSWKDQAAYVEFKALDGYVSRIPVERFDRYPAYLVFRKIGSREFSVDNRQQHEANVSLAPYYLVWDNIHRPELIEQGGTYWPYQVSEISLTQAYERDRALGKATRNTLDLEKYCLSCHQVRGYGGSKAPLDLAVQAKTLGKEKFLAWVLDPAAVKPGTGMPALSPAMPEPERRALASRLLEYLNSLSRK
jgi:mono/diheme cytochrome c family protein